MDILDDLLALNVPDNSAGKNQFDIYCPCCGERKLNVNIRKNVFRCVKCDVGGGALGLFVYFQGGDPQRLKSDEEYRKEWKEKWAVFSGSTLPQKDNVERPVKKRIDVDPANLDSRDKAYRKLLSLLSLSEEHRLNLISRGLTDEDIDFLNIRTYPVDNFEKYADELLKQNISLEGIPGFYLSDDNVWKLKDFHHPGFLIPVLSIDKKIQGIQIRFTEKNIKPKYKWLSSTDMKMGSPAQTWSHFIGFPEATVFLTEGPLKGDIINKFTDLPVIAIPGVSAILHLASMLAELKKMGVKHIKICFDMDYLTNPSVRKAYNKLVKLIETFDLTFTRMTWDEQYKGLDDYLLKQHEKAEV